VEAPAWVRDPFSFARYFVSGFLFIALGAAFFPHTIDNATRAVSITVPRSELVLFTWLVWALAIGLVFHSFFRAVYDLLLEPRPRREDLARKAFEAALPGIHPPPPPALRAIYAATLHGTVPEPTASRGRREMNAIESAYSAVFALAITGIFIAVHPDRAPLVSTNYPELQGAAFFVAAGVFGFFLWRRDAAFHHAAAAAIPWDSEEVATRVRAAFGRMQKMAGAPGAGPTGPQAER